MIDDAEFGVVRFEVEVFCDCMECSTTRPACGLTTKVKELNAGLECGRLDNHREFDVITYEQAEELMKAHPNGGRVRTLRSRTTSLLSAGLKATGLLRKQ